LSPRGVPEGLIRLEICRLLVEELDGGEWFTVRELLSRLRHFQVSSRKVARYLRVLRERGFVSYKPSPKLKFGFWRVEDREGVYHYITSQLQRERWFKRRYNLWRMTSHEP